MVSTVIRIISAYPPIFVDVNNYVHSYCHNVINNVTLLLNIIEQNIKCTAEQIHAERISTITEMPASVMP